MKNISRTRDGFSLPEFLAYCGVSAALRPFLRGKHYAIGLVLENWDERKAYLKAVSAFTRSDSFNHWRPNATPIIFKEAKTFESLDNIAREFVHDQVVILFQDEASIPEEVRPAFDAIIVVPTASTRQIKGVIKWLYRISVSDAEAEVLSQHPWSRLRLMLRPGRSVARIISNLAKVQGAPNMVEKAIKETDSVGPRLEDLHGYGEAKTWGVELAEDLHDWQAGKIQWNDVDRGVLLSGPPGVGKTMFALALGRTCGVPVVLGSVARWQAKGHMGDLLKAMRKAFDDARKSAPSILFIDEIDGFGDRETIEPEHANYVRQVINGLLECLDGAENRDGVVVVGACNHPQFLDAAAKRPGRLDRHIEIPYPDSDARLAIAEGYMEQTINPDRKGDFIRRTTGATGADIDKWVREARRIARRTKRALSGDDLFDVLPPVQKLSPDMLECVAVHELGHAVAGVLLDGEKLLGVSIEESRLLSPGRQALGGAVFEQQPMRRRTRAYYLDQIAIFLGGIAAETLFFGDYVDGAGGKDGADLHAATNLALIMERHLGMGETLASFGDIDHRRLDTLKAADPLLIRRAGDILQEQLERVKAVLQENRAAIEYLVGPLVEQKYLSGETIQKAVNDLGMSIPKSSEQAVS
jgi:cell division protease FtsH